MNMDQSKNSQQNISQSDPAIYKKDNSSQPTWWGGGSYPGNTRFF